MAILRKVGEASKNVLLKHKRVYIPKSSESEIDMETLHDMEHPELKGIIPDPYPKTEEDRRKAAAKYNLHPDEYKPFPPDYRYTGDYPDVPEINAASKDPYYPWDFPEAKRNHGEPLPKTFDLLGEDRFHNMPRELYSLKEGAGICLLFFAVTFGLFHFSPTTSQPLMEKQYPGSGTHYTFDLVK